MTEASAQWVDCEAPAELRRDGRQVGKVWLTSRGWAWAAQYGGLYETSEASGTYVEGKAEAQAACERWLRRRGCS